MRNLYKPNRFKVASIQAQQTLGGDVMQADEEGDYVEFRDYRRALDEIEMMKHTVKYWEIEAQTDHARWLRVMEDYERLKDKSNCQAECLNAFDVKLSQAEAENASLKKDVDRLRDRYAEATQENANLKASLERSTTQYNGIIDTQLKVIDELKAKVEHIDLLKSVVEKFFNSADLKNPLDAQSHCAIIEKLKQLPDCILDFTEEQVRDNPAWALAVFRHKVKEMQYKRVHDLNAIGGEQEENARLKDQIELWKLRSDNWQKFCQLTRPDLFNENARLKAEVERLRKAGDALEQEVIGCYFEQDDPADSESLRAWRAAKEGKQS